MQHAHLPSAYDDAKCCVLHCLARHRDTHKSQSLDPKPQALPFTSVSPSLVTSIPPSALNLGFAHTCCRSSVTPLPTTSSCLSHESSVIGHTPGEFSSGHDHMNPCPNSIFIGSLHTAVCAVYPPVHPCTFLLQLLLCLPTHGMCLPCPQLLSHNPASSAFLIIAMLLLPASQRNCLALPPDHYSTMQLHAVCAIVIFTWQRERNTHV